MQAGASGYMLKNAAGNDLIDAIRVVAGGKPWLQPEIAERLMTLAAGGIKPPPKPAAEALIEPLTMRKSKCSSGWPVPPATARSAMRWLSAPVPWKPTWQISMAS
jgi:hypothetical protein